MRAFAILQVRQLRRALRGGQGDLLGAALFGHDAQKCKIVFNLSERLEHCFSILGHIRFVCCA
ncbi:hypothetical protein D3C80_1714530 [compost metagenome]